MSFILDALKKSEAERQRQSGPTLLELRITQPRRRYPAWALWVGVLLALNVAVVLYALLRRPASPEPAVATAPAPTAPAAGTSAAVAAAPTGAATTAPGAPTAAGITTVAPLAPGPAPVASAAAPVAVPLPAPAPASAPEQAVNPADNEPAVPASAAAGNSAPATAAAYASLPNLASLGGDVPSLQLNLLDYSPVPGERFALINMHRVREGDVLPEGPRVLAITRDGVAMEFHGQDFMLHSGGSASSP